jgi:hypothetical protein
MKKQQQQQQGKARERFHRCVSGIPSGILTFSCHLLNKKMKITSSINDIRATSVFRYELKNKDNEEDEHEHE